jgi:2-oxo-4-hydroxy-4-carboxy--5-ureidoimidazoline (OHCU) decarboxylase
MDNNINTNNIQSCIKVHTAALLSIMANTNFTDSQKITIVNTFNPVVNALVAAAESQINSVQRTGKTQIEKLEKSDYAFVEAFKKTFEAHKLKVINKRPCLAKILFLASISDTLAT